MPPLPSRAIISRSAKASLLLALASIPQAHASTTHDEQVWVNLTSMGNVTDKVVYFAEVQPRAGDSASDVNLIALRGAVGLKLSPKVSLYQGYGHFITPVDSGRDINEERSFQQLNVALGKPLGGELTSRTRFEQRWRSDGREVGFRLREMIRYERPLKANSDAVNALVYAEGFVALNDTDWGVSSGFDQLRTFVGAEIGLKGLSTFEIGYLNQAINRPNNQIQMNHVASISLFYRH